MAFTPPDPEKMFQTLERLRDIFREAADRSETSAKPLLEELSLNFNTLVNKTLSTSDPFQLTKIMIPLVRDMQKTMAQLNILANKDPRVIPELISLQQALSQEMQNLMPGLGGGIGFPPSQGKQPPSPPTPPAPKKPGGGKFDL